MKGPGFSLAVASSAILFTSPIYTEIFGVSFCMQDKYFNQTTNRCEYCPVKNSFSLDYKSPKCYSCSELKSLALSTF
jgi:hypothetical protein